MHIYSKALILAFRLNYVQVPFLQVKIWSVSEVQLNAKVSLIAELQL